LSTTASYADLFDKSGGKIKKNVNKISFVPQSNSIPSSDSVADAFAKIFVYSMGVDGDVREVTPVDRMADAKLPKQAGFIAGSRAVDSLERMITSIESLFHPSNNGPWTLIVCHSLLLADIGTNRSAVDDFYPATEFGIHQALEGRRARYVSNSGGELISSLSMNINSACFQTRRLTPSIRRAFVNILKTPAFLAMFAKDPVSMSFAQGALRSLAMLEPQLVMPELLERAYGGLEVVNETHRTTAVLSTLSGIARPLVTESIFLGGQKHIVPLLELCIPGIDVVSPRFPMFNRKILNTALQNDPVKTVCATMFIVAVVQHIKIGDLSQGGISLSGDEPGYEMDVDDVDRLPDGTEIGDAPRLSKSEERSLVRDSTASFAGKFFTFHHRKI